jgi:hypothetical protein
MAVFTPHVKGKPLNCYDPGASGSVARWAVGELPTDPGRQEADVALLVRRVADQIRQRTLG